MSGVEEEIKQLTEHQIIVPSTSRFNSPAFPILKRNGKIRVVIDYRELNKLTSKTPYIFPTISKILSQLNHSIVFSKIDLNLGYYQIPMEKESIKYTAFSLKNENMNLPACHSAYLMLLVRFKEQWTVYWAT